MRRRPKQLDAKWDVNRGRHKKRQSRETRYWDEHHLPEVPKGSDGARLVSGAPGADARTPAEVDRSGREPKPSLPPPPPGWMDAETAAKLYALRREIA